MTDKELRDAAEAKFGLELSHLKKTTRGLKNFAAPSSSEWGKALGERQAGLDLLAQIGGSPPPPPPPPGTGTLLSKLSQFRTEWGNDEDHSQCVNRWRVSPIGENPFTDERYVGTPWPGLSGPSIVEVSTPQGPGFQFISTPEQEVGSGGKKTEVHDNTHTRPEGQQNEFSGKLMFPAAGNPDGFPRNLPSWGVFWDHHGKPNVPFQMGVSTTDDPYKNHIYAMSMGRQVFAAAEIVYDRWYTWRYQVKWSAGSDGFCKWWLDGQLLGNWSGPTMLAGDTLNLQFGFYSWKEKRNEVWLADIRKA